MKVTRAQYFLITGNDRPGEVSNLLNTLKQNNVNLDGMWAYGTPNGRADIYLVPENPEQLKNVLSGIGISSAQGTCFRITGADEVGALTSIMSTIARQDINLGAINATAVNGEIGGYIWCRSEEVEKVAKALSV